ncbi:MAG: exosortase system-associated protein, TIGR04073 family [Deltaproteobacteria bacterium]|nr:exosortase system-associated protein, TIGR04073 family [Deltaproteobacteria bacterium]
MKRLALLIVFLTGLFFFGSMSDVYAQAGEESTGAKIGLKFARGVVNTGLGLVIDWPKTIYYDTKKEGPAYGFTVGLFKGIGVGLGRTLVGVYELVTFPVPYPEDYKPILTPDFPFQPGETHWD